MTKEKIIIRAQNCSKTFFQNRIRQAYQNGKQDGFKEKDNLIKYLENKITERRYENDVERYAAYQDILERLKSGKYE